VPSDYENAIPLISFLNHSPQPTCRYDAEAHAIVATEALRVGDEATVNYFEYQDAETYTYRHAAAGFDPQFARLFYEERTAAAGPAEAGRDDRTPGARARPPTMGAESAPAREPSRLLRFLDRKAMAAADRIVTTNQLMIRETCSDCAPLDAAKAKVSTNPLWRAVPTGPRYRLVRACAGTQLWAAKKGIAMLKALQTGRPQRVEASPSRVERKVLALAVIAWVLSAAKRAL
jgi:hypothetical protein